MFTYDGTPAVPAPAPDPNFEGTLVLPGLEPKKPAPADHVLTLFSDEEKYAVEGEMARGGMGMILSARDRDLRREVAMKVMLDGTNEQVRARFVEEAQVTGQLEHPNIVPVHELGVDAQGRLFFTMKKVQGRSLAEILKAPAKEHAAPSGGCSLTRLLNVFTSISHAVAFAHSKGVVHRDLKPANVMVGDYGEVLVMDWGLAKVGSAGEGAGRERAGAKGSREIAKVGSHRTDAGGGLTLDGTVLGTPHYMSPEQASGDVSRIDARSDIYSLGAILYEILTGMPPVEGKTILVLLRNVQEGNIHPPDRRAPERHLPRELSAVAMRALARRPEDRYATVESLRRDVELYLEGRAVSAKADTAWEALVKLVKRNRGVSVALTAASLVLAGVVSAAFWINVREKREAQGQRDRAELKEAEASKALADFRREQSLRMEQQRTAAPALVEKARRAIERKAFESALKDVEIAAGFDPDLAEARFLKGALLVVAGKLDAAGSVMEEFAIRFGATRPGDAADGKRLAELCRLAREGRTGEAESGFSSVFSKRGEFALAETQHRSVTGRLQLYQQQIDRAWPGLGHRLTIDPEGNLAYEHRGNTPIADVAPLKSIPLTRLDLGSAPELINLSPLEGMPLKYFKIRESKLRDLGPLKGMPLLEADFTQTRVDDLRPLAGMALRRLMATNSQVSDLGPLAGMPLESLSISGCAKVSDLSPLKGAPLTRLDLLLTTVSDLGPLRGMALEDLVCFGTQVSDLAPLRGMPLKKLNLGMTPVKDFSVLKELPLEELEVRTTAFMDLDLLKGKALSSLGLGETRVTDISPLREFPLRRLELWNTPVADLSALKGKALTGLSITGTKVKSLEPLRGMPLTSLDLAHTDVTDLTPLEGMKLETLSFSEEPIVRGFEVVRGMKSMKSISRNDHDRDVWRSTLPPAEHWEAYDNRQKIVRLPKITEWRLLGPFPVSAPEPFPPESVALDGEFTSGGKPIRWERFEAPRESGLVDLGARFGGAVSVKAYAFAEITCSAEREAIFGGGNDDSLTLWVNGSKVYEDSSMHHYSKSGFSLRTKLRAGKNTVLARCGNGQGDWKFSVGFAPVP